MKEVLIADDHPIFRAGLRQIIENNGEYKVVAESSDGTSCVASIQMTKPDILILDLSMPQMDGYEVLEWVGKHCPELPCIIISMYSSRAFAMKAKRNGARAFIAKEDATSEIHNALLAPVHRFYLSASVGGSSGKPLTPIAATNRLSDQNDGILPLLSPAENKVFDLVSKSLTSRQIGEKLGLSHRTIQTHRHNISKKLELGGSNSLLQFAIQYRAENNSR